MGFVWVSPPDTVVTGLVRYDRSILDGLFDLLDLFSARAEAYAKQNAPWADQTGAARQGLRSFVEKSASGAVLYLVSSVFYGVFLETGTRNMGPRPILVPTLETLYGPLMAALRALVGGR